MSNVVEGSQGTPGKKASGPVGQGASALPGLSSSALPLIPLHKSGEALAPGSLVDVIPPIFELHLFDDSVDRFQRNMELTSYRGKGEAVLPAGVYSGVTVLLAALHDFAWGFPADARVEHSLKEPSGDTNFAASTRRFMSPLQWLFA